MVKQTVDYQQRAANLRKFFGGMSYAQYLRTELWERIRNAVLLRDGGNCLACGREAACVHHRSYDEETLKGSTLEWLVSLCSGCHLKVEFHDDGAKRSCRSSETAIMTLIPSMWRDRRSKKSRAKERRRLGIVTQPAVMGREAPHRRPSMRELMIKEIRDYSWLDWEFKRKHPEPKIWNYSTNCAEFAAWKETYEPYLRSLPDEDLLSAYNRVREGINELD